MRRPSSVEPFTPAPVALHPGLKAALDHLDIQLDEELMRFRQQRFRQSGEKRFVDTTNENRLLDSTVEALSRLPHLQQQLQPQFREQLQPRYQEQPRLQESSPSLQTAEPSLDADIWETPPSTMTTFDARRVVREMRSPQPDLTDDYLASSSELIRNLSQPEPTQTQRKPTLLETLLTPLGVGSMLLLLLSSVSLGYLLMNPANLGFLAAIGRSPETDPNLAIAPGSQSLSPDLTADEFVDVNLNTLSQLPRNGRPANGRPATVVTVPRTASPTVLPSPSPEAASSSNGTIQTVTIPAPPVSTTAQTRATTAPAPARTATRPAPARAAAARPSAPARPAPAAAAAPPAPTTTVRIPPPPQILPSLPPAPTAAPAISQLPPTSTISQAPPEPSDRYYVVTDYTGDPSLSQARQAVNDAYVRTFNDGTKVQMGAFTDAASAADMAQRLQQQGVPAQVYKP